jgi:NAD(P)-dependent dehydrogenase (short-subunit alcohol dehydrogenase family)
MNLNGTAAIVSGGASGLGEATVRDLSAAGCKVVVADLNEQRGTELAKEVGGEFARTDVSDEQPVAAAVAVAEASGRRCVSSSTAQASAGHLARSGATAVRTTSAPSARS